MMEIELSVIIPTRGRPETLIKGLEFLAHQSCDCFELVIVDDSEDEEIAPFMEKKERSWPFPLVLICSRGKGPAFARNLGVDSSRGERVLFLGDDTWARDVDFLRRHLARYRSEGDVAVLGQVEWDPEIEITDFMRFLAPNGPQFRYGNIADPQDAGFLHFFTSNISLSRHWFEIERFSEDFPHAALEDIELGYRLEKRGLRIAFEPAAVCFHHHPYELEAFCARMEKVGEAARIFIRKHPECHRFLFPYPKWLMRWGTSFLLTIGVTSIISRKLYYWASIGRSYLHGYGSRGGG